MGVMKRIYTALSEGDAISDTFLKRVCTTGYKGSLSGNDMEEEDLPGQDTAELQEKAGTDPDIIL